jgi:outer membrane protein TolC
MESMSCNPSKLETTCSRKNRTSAATVVDYKSNVANQLMIWHCLILCVVSAAVFLAGCRATPPAYLRDTGDMSYYLDQSTTIEYPDTEVASLDEVTQAFTPITVIDPDFSQFEDISLEDAVSYALQNAKVLRGYGTPNLQGTRVSPGQDNLENGPAAAGTIYNVAVRQTEPGFIGTPGQISNPGSILTNTGLDVNQGVEAALADFDAQFTGGVNWTRSDEPRNTVPNNPLTPLVFQQDQVQWNSEIAKKSANGTQMFFRNVNTYTSNTNPLADPDGNGGFLPGSGLQVLESWYRTSLEAEIRQPLLRGRGAFINRMPIVISRISTDQELANLEAQLQNFVTNVEIRYWDLYCAYRTLDTAKTGRDAALQTWRIVKDQFDEGADVNIQQVAQASEQYHFFDAQVIDAYNSLLNAESALRFLMGWAATDGRVLRPSDEPVMAPIEFSWFESLCEALTYRPELRQQRWEIKKRELALAYSKNGLLPELNVTALYRWLGLGNRFGTSADNLAPFPAGEDQTFNMGIPTESGALNELWDGNYQEFSLGLDFRVPVGYRRELANVRNAQLKLAREIARLEDTELDVSKNLSEAFRALAANQLIMQASFNRWKDSSIEEAHFEELRDAGVETLDVALDAQRRRAQSEIAFYNAMCEYNKVIALIHRRKGTILPYCGVSFAEGPWPGKAYMDASEHARRRGASRHLNYGWSRPQVISRGPDSPTANNSGMVPAGYPQSTHSTDGGHLIEQPMMQGEMLMDPVMGSNSGPYYESPATAPILNAAPGGGTPTPAKHQSSQRIYQDTQVQPTTYTHTIDEAKSPSPASRDGQSTRAKIRPIPAAAAARDMSPRPAKRLRAEISKFPKREAQRSAPTAAPSALSGNPKAVVRTGNLDWKKFGLNPPSQPRNTNVAKINLN